MMAKSYNRILNEYPEYITKEQLYKICNVSKKTALYYLESGLLPCVDSGKKTRRFRIATQDVIVFLKKRDKNPEHYRAKPGWYKGTHVKNLPYRIVQTTQSKKTESYLKRWLKEYPDVMKSDDVAKATGYALNTAIGWCSSKKLHHFLIRRAYLVPKLSLIDFMMSDAFDGIKVMKSEDEEFWQHYVRSADTVLKN